MPKLRALLASVLLTVSITAHTAYDAASSRGVDLSGRWRLNVEASDDAEAALAEKLRKDAERMARYARRAQMERPAGAAPDLQSPLPPPSRERQKQRMELFRTMLVMGEFIGIEQQGAVLTISSDRDARRYTAGARTQASMPEGDLADVQAGWDGDWFIIDRNVRKGPRALEKFRLLKNGQLEYQMRWSGESELEGIKLRRIYDRAGPPTAANPASGPIP